MSLISDYGTDGGKVLVAPKLEANSIGYSLWRSSMDIYLQRAGAEGIHRIEMSETMWCEMVKNTEIWAANALAAMLQQ